MQQLVIMQEDELMDKIKKAVREAILEKNPYPSRSGERGKIITRKQAADFLGVTPPTVTKLVKEGKITAAIVRGKYRFFESNLLKYLNKTE
jgi:excisionase family DNA binding protein